MQKIKQKKTTTSPQKPQINITKNTKIILLATVQKMYNGILNYFEFELQSRYYVHFRANTLGKGMNPLILPAMS